MIILGGVILHLDVRVTSETRPPLWFSPESREDPGTGQQGFSLSSSVTLMTMDVHPLATEQQLPGVLLPLPRAEQTTPNSCPVGFIFSYSESPKTEPIK